MEYSYWGYYNDCNVQIHFIHKPCIHGIIFQVQIHYQNQPAKQNSFPKRMKFLQYQTWVLHSQAHMQEHHSEWSAHNFRIILIQVLLRSKNRENVKRTMNQVEKRVLDKVFPPKYLLELFIIPPLINAHEVSGNRYHQYSKVYCVANNLAKW